MTPFLEALWRLDAKLVSAGFPAMSPWWRATFEDFYSSTARTAIVRVGRRGGKSSSVCRVSVCEALAGEWAVPPGDLAVVPFVSTVRDEAAARIRTVKAILDALEVGYRPVEGGIELLDRPLVFRTFVSSIAGVSGFTSVIAVADEVAKWRSADSGLNPAREVIASLKPTMATQPNARLFMVSSPLGLEDYHAEAFEHGTTEHQRVYFAPTWEANPTLTEELTHELEQDPRVWLREYAAVPGATLNSAFEADHVDAAFRSPPDSDVRGRAVLLIDASSLRNDTFAWAVGRWVHPQPRDRWKHRRGWGWVPPSDDDRRFDLENPHPRPHFVIGPIGGFEAGAKLTTHQVSKSLIATARAHRVSHVIGDQHESWSWESTLGAAGLQFLELPWTNAAKQEAVLRLRSWMRDGVLNLAPHEALRRQLHGYGERISPSGTIAYSAKSGRHDDYVSLLMLAARADVEQKLPASPLNPQSRTVPSSLTPQ